MYRKNDGRFNQNRKRLQQKLRERQYQGNGNVRNESGYVTADQNDSAKIKMIPGTSISLSTMEISELNRELLNLKLDSDQDPDLQRDFLKYKTTDFETEIKKKMIEKSKSINQDESIIAMESEVLFTEFTKQSLTPEYLKLQPFRYNLPSYQKRLEILELIKNNQVIIIKGDTGCGKTTQIPQYIIDDYLWKQEGGKCRIICAQPRRIAAITVAQRVAEERGEKIGVTSGYQVRLEKVTPRLNSSVLFCTTQIVQKLMEVDAALSGYSHVIVDEVHERHIQIDILVALLKRLIVLRKDVKVILMSATLQAETFSKYFPQAKTLLIQGRMFPVKEYFLEDIIDEIRCYDFYEIERVKKNPRQKQKERARQRRHEREFNAKVAPYIFNSLRNKVSSRAFEILSNPTHEGINENFIKNLIFHISQTKPPGAILVFLPGYSEISNIYNRITTSVQYSASKFIIYPLHSMLNIAEQQAVFEKPPAHVRKIILASQIAETSITVDDVVYVINAGFFKKSHFDNKKNCNVLYQRVISKSNELQRIGRTGRTQNGFCYHLYTRARSNALEFAEKPEILCISLDETILSIKSLFIRNVYEFFDSLIDPPPLERVTKGMDVLERLNALDENDDLTPLGYHLARIPVSPQIGKMIILGSIFSCVDPVTTIAASMSSKTPFYNAIGKEREVLSAKQLLANNTASDHFMVVNAFNKWKELRDEEYLDEKQFCKKSFLAENFLYQIDEIKKQFCDILSSSKFLKDNNSSSEHHNLNAKDSEIVCSIVGGGLYPNIAFKSVKIRSGRTFVLCNTAHGPGKLLKNSMNFASSYQNGYIVYNTRQRMASGTFLLDASNISPFAVVFFGDNIKPELKDGVQYLSVGDFIKFRCNQETLHLILKLRDGLSKILENKICNPSPTDWEGEEGKVLRAIIKLITKHGKNLVFDYIDGLDEKTSDSSDSDVEGQKA